MASSNLRRRWCYIRETKNSIITRTSMLSFRVVVRRSMDSAGSQAVIRNIVGDGNPISSTTRNWGVSFVSNSSPGFGGWY